MRITCLVIALMLIGCEAQVQVSSQAAEKEPESALPTATCSLWVGEGNLIKSGDDIYQCKIIVTYKWVKVKPEELKAGYKP